MNMNRISAVVSLAVMTTFFGCEAMAQEAPPTTESNAVRISTLEARERQNRDIRGQHFNTHFNANEQAVARIEALEKRPDVNVDLDPIKKRIDAAEKANQDQLKETKEAKAAAGAAVDTANSASVTANTALQQVSDIAAITGGDTAALDEVRADVASNRAKIQSVDRDSKRRDAVLAARPELDLGFGKKGALGAGIGYADGEGALSVGGGIQLFGDRMPVTLRAHGGTDFGGQSFVAGSSVGISW